MLHFEADNGKINSIEASGSCESIAVLLAGAIGSIYQHLSAANEDAGEDFRDMILTLIAEDGIVWEKDSVKSLGQGNSILYIPQEDS